MSMRTAWPSSPQSEASWSSSPVSAPHHTFSIREHSRARATRSGASAPATAHSARQSEIESAAEDESPASAGRSPENSSRQGRSSTPARRSSEAAPRAKRLQPSGASDGRPSRPSAKLSVSPEIEGVHLDPVPGVERHGTHGDASVDGERQTQPEVVVGVLSDQIDPAGSESLDTRATSTRVF